MQNLSDNFNPGAFKNRYDGRDYQWGPLATAMGIEEEFDWEKGWDSEAELGSKIKIEDQDGSSSCVGQGTSSLGDLLNYVETSKWEDFSAKGVYAQIHLPGGGAYPRDGLNIAVNYGFNLESDLPSYENGNPPSEKFMIRSEDITNGIRAKAEKYQALKYFALPINNIDAAATAIKNHWGIIIATKGSNPGWSQPDLRPPKNGESTWGHEIYGTAAFLRNNKKTIKIPNSWGIGWGDNGYGYLNEDYFKSGDVWTPYVLIDQKNIKIKDMIQTIKFESNPEIYMVSNVGKELRWLAGWESYKEMLKMGWVEEFIELEDEKKKEYIVHNEQIGILK